MDMVIYVNDDDGFKKSFEPYWQTDRENKPGVDIKYPIFKWLILVSYYIISHSLFLHLRLLYSVYILSIFLYPFLLSVLLFPKVCCIILYV